MAPVALVTPGVSITDWGMLAVVSISQVVTWTVMLRGGVAGVGKRAAAAASASATQSAAIQALVAEISRLATGLEGQTKELQKHLLDDMGWQSSRDEILKQMAETQTTLSRTLENQQRQLMNVALDIAPGETVHVPARPGRARR